MTIKFENQRQHKWYVPTPGSETTLEDHFDPTQMTYILGLLRPNLAHLPVGTDYGDGGQVVKNWET